MPLLIHATIARLFGPMLALRLMPTFWATTGMWPTAGSSWMLSLAGLLLSLWGRPLCTRPRRRTGSSRSCAGREGSTSVLPNKHSSLSLINNDKILWINNSLHVPIAVFNQFQPKTFRSHIRNKTNKGSTLLLLYWNLSHNLTSLLLALPSRALVLLDLVQLVPEAVHGLAEARLHLLLNALKCNWTNISAAKSAHILCSIAFT